MPDPKVVSMGRVSHAERRRATRAALISACREAIKSGEEVSMPQLAQAAGVAEATAYRYFPDLVSLVKEGLEGLWPAPFEALASVVDSVDVIERVDAACEFLLRRSHRFERAIRAVIADTVTRPETGRTRPGFRFGLIALALTPLAGEVDGRSERVEELRDELAAVVGAEALFALTDLAGMDIDRAIGTLRRAARTLTAAALSDLG
ncbi:TetR/AcrR family transcriptional regulator [Leifsonia sp. NPDC056665]|uniref:TetR/AcrR family transcriptional regulator n=1 Tax=Leifsonia sp. NPDC056665 TaxID=3345901 RepID=UPI0036A31BE6